MLNVGYRRNAVALAKQIASVDRLSGGRLTVGLALGGWPEDYAASDVSLEGRGAAFDATLATMRRVWAGELAGASGPLPALPAGRPGVLIGGLAPASFRRVAAAGHGWVAPSFGLATLTDGIASVRQAWQQAGRSGQPRVVVERYFSLGEDADAVADHYIEHYYSPKFFAYARADTLTSRERLLEEVRRARLRQAATTSCCCRALGIRSRLHLLADALVDVGWEALNRGTARLLLAFW